MSHRHVPFAELPPLTVLSINDSSIIANFAQHCTAARVITPNGDRALCPGDQPCFPRASSLASSSCDSEFDALPVNEVV
jgi:hypothetical protein